jgi:Aminoglycoside-2''-adenylyltransferase
MTMAMTQLDEIRGLDQAFAQAEVAYWLFGGWAVDFHAGRVTRAHSDVDIAVWRRDLKVVRRLLADAGWRVLTDRPGDGYVTFERGGVRLDIALLERDSTGAIYTPTDDGRGEWPEGSFGTAIVSLLGVDAHIIDAKSLIADKSVSHGADADVKDEADLRVLRSLDESSGRGPGG